MLIIETGEGLPNANSYVTTDELAEFGISTGANLPENKELILLQAMEYLEQFTVDGARLTRKAYKGYRATADQALEWPRRGVLIDGVPLATNVIPAKLKRAQMQLAVEAITYDLMPTSDGFAVASEKVDVIEVEYATGGRLSGSTPVPAPVFTRVNALLAGLLRSGGAALRSVRI